MSDPIPRPADPRLVDFATAIRHRWIWPSARRVTIDGKQVVNVETILVEVLRVLDAGGWLLGSKEAQQATLVEVETAARMLARYHVMYEDPPHGRGWQEVLTHLDHAHQKALETARSPRVIDQINDAYETLRREVARRDGE